MAGLEQYNDAFALLNRVRELGFAVAAFTPEELSGAVARRVEDHMVEAGWTAIEMLAAPGQFPPAVEEEQNGTR